jgi:hypothetical protein
MHRLSNDAKLAYPDNRHAFGASPFFKGEYPATQAAVVPSQSAFPELDLCQPPQGDFLTTPGGTI